MSDIDDLIAKALRRRGDTHAMTTPSMPAPIPPMKGTVTASNDRGVMLAGESGWRNWSKFAPLPKYQPTVGEIVTLSLDRQGYIRVCSNKAGEELRPGPVRTDLVSPSYSSPPPAGAAPMDPDEARRIVRLSIMKSACSVWGEDSDADPAKLATKVAYTFSALLKLYDTQTVVDTAGLRAALAPGTVDAAAVKAEFIAEMTTPATVATHLATGEERDLDDLPF